MRISKNKLNNLKGNSACLKYNGKIVLVDVELLEDILNKKWHLITVNGKDYLKHSYREGYKVKSIYLHQFISGYKVCGFKNNNSCDCRYGNLYDKSKKVEK
jgi:hypothetical protein